MGQGTSDLIPLPATSFLDMLYAVELSYTINYVNFI